MRPGFVAIVPVSANAFATIQFYPFVPPIFLRIKRHTKKRPTNAARMVKTSPRLLVSTWLSSLRKPVIVASVEVALYML